MQLGGKVSPDEIEIRSGPAAANMAANNLELDQREIYCYDSEQILTVQLAVSGLNLATLTSYGHLPLPAPRLSSIVPL